MPYKIQLSKGEFWKGRSKKGALWLQEGEVWVTFTGCLEDFILQKGDRIPIYAGEMLMECLSERAVIAGSCEEAEPLFARRLGTQSAC